MLFSLKLQRDNRQNALSVAPAKEKTGEKGCIFQCTAETKQPDTMTGPSPINFYIHFRGKDEGCGKSALAGRENKKKTEGR